MGDTEGRPLGHSNNDPAVYAYPSCKPVGYFLNPRRPPPSWKNRAIRELGRVNQRGGFYSRYFLVQKQGGTLRTEQVSPPPEVQEADHTKAEAGCPEGRLVCNSQPQGHFFSDTNLGGAQTVSKVCLRRHDLRILCLPFGISLDPTPSPGVWMQSWGLCGIRVSE